MEYELIKSQMGLPAGAIFKRTKSWNGYLFTFSDSEKWIRFPAHFVEDNPKFFRKVVHSRWRAEKSESYYSISSGNNGVLYIVSLSDDYSPSDNKRFLSGNYFETKEQAKKTIDSFIKAHEEDFN